MRVRKTYRHSVRTYNDYYSYWNFVDNIPNRMPSDFAETSGRYFDTLGEAEKYLKKNTIIPISSMPKNFFPFPTDEIFYGIMMRRTDDGVEWVNRGRDMYNLYKNGGDYNNLLCYSMSALFAYGEDKELKAAAFRMLEIESYQATNTIYFDSRSYNLYFGKSTKVPDLYFGTSCNNKSLADFILERRYTDMEI